METLEGPGPGGEDFDLGEELRQTLQQSRGGYWAAVDSREEARWEFLTGFGLAQRGPVEADCQGSGGSLRYYSLTSAGLALLRATDGGGERRGMGGIHRLTASFERENSSGSAILITYDNVHANSSFWGSIAEAEALVGRIQSAIVEVHRARAANAEKGGE